jgi:putative tricarboxylic transport membrane protein
VQQRIDLGLSAGITALGVFLLVQAGRIPAGSVSDPIGPAGALRVMSIVFICLGVVLVVQHLRRARALGASATSGGVPGAAPDEPGHPASASRAVGFWAMTAAYVILLPSAGYLLTTPVYMAGGMWLLGIRRWWLIAAVAVGGTVIQYGLFASLLGVLLPLGPLEPLRDYLIIGR